MSVTGFVPLTYEPTTFEKNVLIPLVVVSWGRKEPNELVNMKLMIEKMNEYLVKYRIYSKKGKVAKVSGPRMRKLYHYIRVKNLVPNLVATSKGYFKTDNREQIKDYINSCFERANSFSEVGTALMSQNCISHEELRNRRKKSRNETGI